MDTSYKNVGGSFKCSFCSKNYTRKSSFEKHQITCDFLHQSKREIKIFEEEHTNQPSYSELVFIVQEFTKKCVTLEKKVEELENQNNKKKKINITQLLTKHYSTNIKVPYQDWLNDICVSQEHIDIFINENMMKSIIEIIKSNLVINISNPNENQSHSESTTTSSNNHMIPLYCYNSTFYFYTKEDKKWMKMHENQYIQLLQSIHQKILKHFYDWNQIQKSIMSENKLDEIFNKNVLKLMSFNCRDEKNISKFKSEINIFFKKNIQDVLLNF
jgi:hypothetical protein